jgi:plasmid maintenance system antidote protein VapI
MENKNVHIGKLINEYFKKDGRSVTWLAKQLNVKRSKIYRIYNNSYIDTELLMRISLLLDHNFFSYYIQSFNEKSKIFKKEVFNDEF